MWAWCHKRPSSREAMVFVNNTVFLMHAVPSRCNVIDPRPRSVRDVIHSWETPHPALNDGAVLAVIQARTPLWTYRTLTYRTTTFNVVVTYIALFTTSASAESNTSAFRVCFFPDFQRHSHFWELDLMSGSFISVLHHVITIAAFRNGVG